MLRIEVETDEKAIERYAQKRAVAEKAKLEYLSGIHLNEKIFDQYQAKVNKWRSDKVVAGRKLVVGPVTIPLPGRRVKEKTNR